MFNFDEIKNNSKVSSRFERQINRIKNGNYYVDGIIKVVNEAINNIKVENCRSFIIYGEPQSGKTEMMVALSSKLLDEGFKIIVVLVNDDVDLLDQNLNRFAISGIDPTPRSFRSVLDPDVKIQVGEWVIFSKKNASDLRNLIQKIGQNNNIVVIDDEADYATPNGKINSGDRTKINCLVDQLRGKNGVYIGVTATPARLDLNHTFENDNERWIDFPPPPSYVGKDVFFPETEQEEQKFSLILLPDVNDDPSFLRGAIFSFLVNVAYLNAIKNNKEDNYSLLIHTSGKKDDHSIDFKQAQKIFNVLLEEDEQAKKYYESIFNIAKNRYSGHEATLTRYIFQNRNKYTIEVINSDREEDSYRATHPTSPFTLIIGGNKVSRGVTFNNLLSMYFTRDVKLKIQQDTYIQRARMFGYREKYLQYFELHIPETLYLDWHRCFIFHRLGTMQIKSGQGAPVWYESRRIAAASPSSISKARVIVDKGEMSFGLFEMSAGVENILYSNKNNIEKLEELATLIESNGFPPYLLQHIKNLSRCEDEKIAIHSLKPVPTWTDVNQELISRDKSFMGTSELEKHKYPEAVHHVQIFYNKNNKARMFYKYEGDIKLLARLKKNR